MEKGQSKGYLPKKNILVKINKKIKPLKRKGNTCKNVVNSIDISLNDMYIHNIYICIYYIYELVLSHMINEHSNENKKLRKLIVLTTNHCSFIAFISINEELRKFFASLKWPTVHSNGSEYTFISRVLNQFQSRLIVKLTFLFL